MIKIYNKLFLFGVLLCAIMGFILPDLISSNNNLDVLVGLAGVVGGLYLVGRGLVNFFERKNNV